MLNRIIFHPDSKYGNSKFLEIENKYSQNTYTVFSLYFSIYALILNV